MYIYYIRFAVNLNSLTLLEGNTMITETSLDSILYRTSRSHTKLKLRVTFKKLNGDIRESLFSDMNESQEFLVKTVIKSGVAKYVGWDVVTESFVTLFPETITAVEAVNATA